MKNKRSFLLIAAGFVLLGLIFAWLFSSEETITKSKLGKDIKVDDMLVRNSKLKEEQNGKLLWELAIGEMVYDKATDTNQMKDVKGKWYRADGSVLELVSTGGSIVMAKKDVVLQGNVVATLSSGGKLEADQVSWFRSEDKITAQGKVRITKEDLLALADQAITDSGLEQLRLAGNAEVQKGVQP
ncbi:MAG: LPS export ABC transporter periplasmic protein LptC [Acidaminococcaceae bacterium]